MPLNKESDLNKENNEKQETLDRKKVLESMNLRIIHSGGPIAIKEKKGKKAV